METEPCNTKRQFHISCVKKGHTLGAANPALEGRGQVFWIPSALDFFPLSRPSPGLISPVLL